VHLDAESVGDLLESGEVDASVVVGLPALDLLLGDAYSFRELTLRQPGGDAGFDQRDRQLVQRGDLAAGDVPVAQFLIMVQLVTQNFDLAGPL